MEQLNSSDALTVTFCDMSFSDLSAKSFLICVAFDYRKTSWFAI